MATQVSVIHSKWYHLINDLHYTTSEFYQTVEEIMTIREMPDIKLSKVSYSEGGIFSSKREYLRVSRKEYVVDICATPFGTGFFVSWWFGETAGAMQELTGRIPLIGPFFVKVSKTKTYYEKDTANMFKEGIRSCVMEAIDKTTRAKGLRELSELDRKAQETLQ